MIKSKTDFFDYLAADRRALGLGKASRIRIYLHDVYQFQRALRRFEYHLNCGSNIFIRTFARWQHRRRGIRLGFTIPPNVFGPGLNIAHIGTIVVNNGTRVGKNCRLHVGVNIGTSAGHDNLAPTIGDNCYIGPGAKLFGPIVIGNDIAIGANAG